MKKIKVRRWLPYIVAAILLMAAMSAEAAQTTSQAVVNAKILPQITFQTPDSLNILYQKPPNTASQDTTIVINANTAWKLSIKGSNNGYMKSGVFSLANPLKFQYIGTPPGPIITMTGDYKLYLTGVIGVNNLPTRFSQQFSSSDKPGMHKIDIYYKAEANF